MLKLQVFNYAFKIGIILVIIAFIVGFFGNKYQTIEFSLAYYHYLYTLVIIFAGVSHGIVGGFLTSTLICILHILALNFNSNYYEANSTPINYNFQLLFFTLLGIISGYSYELMEKNNSFLNKTITELNKKLQTIQQNNIQEKDSKTATSTPISENDVFKKYYNYLLKFCRLIANCKSEEEVYETLLKTLALDYSMKEAAVFIVKEKGRTLIGKYKKNLNHIEKIEEITINFGEGTIGKAAVTQQIIINNVSDKTNDWQIAIPLVLNNTTISVIGIAKYKLIEVLTTEDIQHISKISEITSLFLQTYVS